VVELGKTPLFGRHDHALDLKGRVILAGALPLPLRARRLLSQYKAGVSPVDPGRFDTSCRDGSMQDAGAEQLNLAPLPSAGSVAVEIDRQGRLPIAPFMREFARLDGDILSERGHQPGRLWSPRLWPRRWGRAMQVLTGEETNDGNDDVATAAIAATADEPSWLMRSPPAGTVEDPYSATSIACRRGDIRRRRPAGGCG